ncbi:MAG: gliding motility-associated ABC transporter substrate-binding protein GldG [Cyclobacteriaceae bacterium]|nr:gliding motility-associated ABC transporter substrate-binding protein GldG [Cyclobacteriaceae bacterium]
MVNLNSKKTESWLILLSGLMLMIVLNQLSARYFFRLDLTEEKRFTISEATKTMLQELDDVAYVDVYLEGDLPSGFKRLRNAIRETLDEFKVYAGDNLQYRFLDPSAAESEKARNEFYNSLAERGIQPTNVMDQSEGKRTEKLIFPGALVSYGASESGVMLLRGNRAAGPAEQLNQSIEGLEYELAKTIVGLSRSEPWRIGIVHGYNGPDTLELAGLSSAMLEYYRVMHVNLPRRQDLSGLDAIVIAKPRDAFSEQDLYKIDQFIMKGGRALFLIDALYVNMDSVSGAGTVAVPYDLNLDDLLFRYGGRVNRNLVLDMNSGVYPVVAGRMGDQPQVRMMPWPYFPLINQYSKHPAVRNSDAMLSRFISTIDTVKADGIVKTPLFFSSPYSRVVNAPIRVSLNDLREEMKPEYFTTGQLPLGYLLEGSFTSAYKNRILPDGVDKNNFVDQGQPSAIFLCGDGDLVVNAINPRTGQPLELGYEPYTQTRYANEDVILNLLHYMLDADGLILARNKEITIRPLDKVKTDQKKTLIQIINILLPILAIIIFGIVKALLRKRKYSAFT